MPIGCSRAPLAVRQRVRVTDLARGISLVTECRMPAGGCGRVAGGHTHRLQQGPLAVRQRVHGSWERLGGLSRPFGAVARPLGHAFGALVVVRHAPSRVSAVAPSPGPCSSAGSAERFAYEGWSRLWRRRKNEIIDIFLEQCVFFLSEHGSLYHGSGSFGNTSAFSLGK